MSEKTVETNDVKKMITELYEKFIKTETKLKENKRMTLKQYFVNCYVKEGIYTELTPFELKHGNLNDVKNLAAQITFKLLLSDDLKNIKIQYDRMSDQELEHLKNM